MHREIQIKQFPIVATHWWPKTRNERFVWENEQYLYCFLPLVHNHVQVIWVRTHIRCVTCVCTRSGSRCIHTGRRRQRLMEGVSEAWCCYCLTNCLIWISLCMFFFPLIETVTYTCHYMTDRLERFDLKISKLDLLKKKRHLHLGCPWGKLIDTKF